MSAEDAELLKKVAQERCDLIARAREEEKHIGARYQNLTFTPDELERANSQGFFRWSAENFFLICRICRKESNDCKCVVYETPSFEKTACGRLLAEEDTYCLLPKGHSSYHARVDSKQWEEAKRAWSKSAVTVSITRSPPQPQPEPKVARFIDTEELPS